MSLISLIRAIKFSLQDVGRNIWLSLVTVIIIILALFTVNMLLTVNLITNKAITSIKDKVDINVFIKTDAEEMQILALKAKIANIEQVKNVEYISKAEALESFKEKHKNNPEILDGLRELGQNPLTPILVIQPKSVDNFESLIVELNKLESEIIESKNFENHEMLLTKINSISGKINQVGILLSSIFIFITLLVVYNSIRVAIYTHRMEISIMRLVGASNWFIKAPYLISGSIYALLGCIAIIAIFYPFLNLLQPYIEAFFVDYSIDILGYFNQNFVKIFGLQFLGAVLVNGVASLIAVGKYSKI